MIYLKWDTNEEQTEKGEPESEGQWRWRGVMDYCPHNFRLIRKENYYSYAGDFRNRQEYPEHPEMKNRDKLFEEADTGKDFYWVVYNVYSDGDTFSRQEGNVDAFWFGESREEALEMKKRAESVDYGYFGNNTLTVCKKMFVEEEL